MIDFSVATDILTCLSRIITAEAHFFNDGSVPSPDPGGPTVLHVLAVSLFQHT